MVSSSCRPDDEQALTKDIVALAGWYGRYGYRRVTASLHAAGRSMNHKRVGRIWRREGLKVPQKPPKRGRLRLNDGFRIFTIIDEASRASPCSADADRNSPARP